MIHIRDEGEPLRAGFNIYPRSNPCCRGFIFRLGPIDFGVRWNPRRKALWWRWMDRSRVIWRKEAA